MTTFDRDICYLSLFSGIGAFEKALDNLSIRYKLIGYCENDKFAPKSYSAIHGVSESLNLGDITKVDAEALPKDIDLITYGFPCQDISSCGYQKGLFNDDGSPTRSGLFFDALRIIEATKPKFAIAENVKNLTSKRFTHEFQIVLDSLEKAGYNNYFKVLNATHHGIPQDRERIFIVSIRKDADTGSFKFPDPVPLQKSLEDLLEDVVDEKYYLSEKAIGKMERFAPKRWNVSVCPTLTTELAHGTGKNLYPKLYKIFLELGRKPRMLTPKECFRLMGFDDESYYRAAAVVSDTQLCKQAGNSIVVDVLMAIFKELFIGTDSTARRKWLDDLLGDCL